MQFFEIKKNLTPKFFIRNFTTSFFVVVLKLFMFYKLERNTFYSILFNSPFITLIKKNTHHSTLNQNSYLKKYDYYT